ncbi:hypothetical protein OF001_U40075 [Pseudomonas sp. OF001]|nr:hypothetical protein OF001_U40075 [Pseudomonas sp. OF001]
MDSGRLRGRPGAGVGVPRHRQQGRRVRRAAASVPGVAGLRRRLAGPAAQPAGDRLDPGRQPAGAAAEQPQAPARLLVDRPLRLPADRPDRQQGPRQRGHRRLPAHLRADQPGRLRGNHPDVHPLPGPRHRRAVRVPRPVLAPPVPDRGAGGDDAVAGRHPADRRLHRQVLRGRRRRREPAVVAARRADPRQRHRRVLLPAGDGQPVPGRAQPAAPRCAAALGPADRRRHAAGGGRPDPAARRLPAAAAGAGAERRLLTGTADVKKPVGATRPAFLFLLPA